MARCHIVREPNAPTSAPEFSGDHFMNTLTGEHYISVDTNGVLSWQLQGGGGVSDHGDLSGLDDDDHPQYHTDSRGDARYYTQTQIDSQQNAQDTLISDNTAKVSADGSIFTHSDVDGTPTLTDEVLAWNTLTSSFEPKTFPGGVTDHGALTGLGDDDHPQYHDDARGDIRYYTKTEIDNQQGIQDTAIALNTAKVSFPEAPNDGQQYARQSNAWSVVSGGGGGGFDPRTTLQLYDDFFSGSEDNDEIGVYGWRSEVSGSGAESIRAPGTITNPGIFRVSTGAAGNSRSSIMLGTAGRQPILLGGGLLNYQTLITFRSANFSANEGIQFGLGDVAEGAGISNNGGIYFEKLPGDTNLFLVLNSNPAQTRVDTGQTLVDGLTLRLEFEVNADATAVQLRVDGVDVGSPITTNIPTFNIGPFYKCDGSAGGVNTQLDIDYFYLTQTLTTAR